MEDSMIACFFDNAIILDLASVGLLLILCVICSVYTISIY